MAETQPKLQPALLSLSATISQYFISTDASLLSQKWRIDLAEAQLEPVFLRELLNFRFANLLIQRPDPLQFILINRAMPDPVRFRIQLA
jgi:hypothetical protein